MQPVLLAYVAGVVLGLWKVDAPVRGRLALGLLWPVGVAAAAITMSILVGAALILFPALGGAVAVGAALAWWFFG